MFPGTILAEVLMTRGVTLFALLLVVLVVALGLIALYLSAETARSGAAGERQRLESIVSQVPDGIFAVRPGPDPRVAQRHGQPADRLGPGAGGRAAWPRRSSRPRARTARRLTIARRS